MKTFENFKKISYSCILLDEESQKKALELIPTDNIDWKKYGHHMTIKLGPLPESIKELKGETVQIRITELGVSDKAVAVKCVTRLEILGDWYREECGKKGIPNFPHITLAVNPDGGKPFMSNQITEWRDISEFIENVIPHITLTGKITEVEA